MSDPPLHPQDSPSSSAYHPTNRLANIPTADSTNLTPSRYRTTSRTSALSFSSETARRSLHKRKVSNHREAGFGDDEEAAFAQTEDDRNSSADEEEVEDNPDDDVIVLDQNMSLRERQEAINKAHPFGLRLWKSALYKKSRSVQVKYEADVHERPHLPPVTTKKTCCPSWLSESEFHVGNIIWTCTFGILMASVYFVVGIVLLLFPPSFRHSKVCFNMAQYLLYPFGKYVQLDRPDPRDRIHSYENARISVNSTSSRRRSSDEDHKPLLSPTSNTSENGFTRTSVSSIHANGGAEYAGSEHSSRAAPEPPAERGFIIHGVGDLFFYLFFFVILAPIHLLVSALCWFFVFTIPMSKVCMVLLSNLARFPLRVKAKSVDEMIASRHFDVPILLCTYRAAAVHYYKYTFGGSNIIFLNLIAIVLFSLAYSVPMFIDEHALEDGTVDPWLLFSCSLVSVIPLSYFIGMAVSSISAQSSLGFGAVVNATFGSIVEIILYCLAIIKQRGLLVEGAIIGSLLGSTLLMPGLSMISGGFKRKEQRLNIKSAGVSSSLLIMSMIGAFTPTFLYRIYGKYELVCSDCPDVHSLYNVSSPASCTSCELAQPHPSSDPFYDRIKPLMYFMAAMLPTSYIVGLFFTLKTHVKMIYEEKKKHVQPTLDSELERGKHHTVPQATRQDSSHSVLMGKDSHGPAPADSTHQSQTHQSGNHHNHHHHHSSGQQKDHHDDEHEGGHDSPEWSKLNSTLVLLVATVAFSLLAEALVSSVNVIMEDLHFDEKIVGLTLFALVPSVTEFVNAISFALSGNIVLSLEIGSAYAVQVALLQLPVLVAFSGAYSAITRANENFNNTFTLIFPTWDVYAVIFGLFLLTYTYIEGRSNYFKGSILTLSYITLLTSFFFAPPSPTHE